MLSLALIVKNEARCLARCLRSVQPLADELVVVDTGSTDNTLPIARDFHAQVRSFAWCDDFSAARNFALAQTTGDWILVLDADEYASESLVHHIRAFIRSRPAVGRLKIVSDFRRNGQLFRSQSFVARLFPRGARFEGRIHEQLVSTLPRLNVEGELWHDGYLELQKADRNVKLLLEEIQRAPANAYNLYQLALEYSSLNQTDQALASLQKAYSLLKGKESFAPNVVVDYLYALLQTKRFDPGLQVLEQAAPLLDDFPDFHLVSGLFYMNLVRSNAAQYIGYLPRIEQAFQRCLALGETNKYRSVHGTGSFLAHYNLGALYQAFGDAARARSHFQHAANAGFEPALKALAISPPQPVAAPK